MPEAERYRNLRDEEVEAMERNGCRCVDWRNVFVAERFRAHTVKNAHFSGDIRLGVFGGDVLAEGGVPRPSGIENATLHNCTVGHDARIANISRHIANYDIEDGAWIENVNVLAVEGETSFGNGERVHVMIEAGGREIPMFDRLSSQFAFLAALRRDRLELTAALARIADAYAASVRSDRGVVGSGARLLDCGTLLNVRIGAAARLQGARLLENGTILSRPGAVCHVGHAVVARSFIFSSDSQIDYAARLQKCFVGQGALVSEGFNAENCLFFANSEALRGEGCSIFAGPYSVSHHKATLLLTAHYSFYNAGSGTNFSNHMYKLGPIHQGVMERGCKSGSGSYMLWPGHVGAFTTVLGQHKCQLDTSAFPFSYLLEDTGRSVLLPSATLFTAGLQRDAAKWPLRDRRAEEDRLDFIRFAVYTPYTVGKLIQARNTLAELHSHTPSDQATLNWRGAEIPRTWVHRGWQGYNFAISLYLGEQVAMALETVLQLSGAEDVEKKMLSTRSWGLGDWCDVGGMIVPRVKLEQVLDGVEDGSVADVASFEAALTVLNDDYPQMAWNWALTTWLAEMNMEPEELTRDDIIQTLRSWRDTLEQYCERVLMDGAKEFSACMQYGYGMDADAETQMADFEGVHGTAGEDEFLCVFEEEINKKLARADTLIAALQ